MPDEFRQLEEYVPPVKPKKIQSALNKLAKQAYDMNVKCENEDTSFQYLMQLSTFQLISSQPLSQTAVAYLTKMEHQDTKSCLQQNSCFSIEIDGKQYKTTFGNQDDELTWNKQIFADSTSFEEFYTQQPCEITIESQEKQDIKFSSSVQLYVSNSEKFNSRLANTKNRHVISAAALLGGELPDGNILQKPQKLVNFFQTRDLQDKDFNFPCLPTKQQLNAIINQDKQEDNLCNMLDFNIDFLESDNFVDFKEIFGTVMNTIAEDQKNDIVIEKQNLKAKIQEAKEIKNELIKEEPFKQIKHKSSDKIIEKPLKRDKKQKQETKSIEKQEKSIQDSPIKKINKEEQQIVQIQKEVIIAQPPTIQVQKQTISLPIESIPEVIVRKSQMYSSNIVTESEVDIPRKSLKQLLKEKQDLKLKQEQESRPDKVESPVQEESKRMSLSEKLKNVRQAQSLDCESSIKLIESLNDVQKLTEYANSRDAILHSIQTFNFNLLKELREKLPIEKFSSLMQKLPQSENFKPLDWQDCEFRRFKILNRQVIVDNKAQITKAFKALAILMHYIYFQESHQLIFTTAEAVKQALTNINFQLNQPTNSYNRMINSAEQIENHNYYDSIYMLIGLIEDQEVYQSVKDVLQFHALIQQNK